MIASLFGTTRVLKIDQTVIEVNNVGYLVHITAKTSSQMSIGRDYQLFTSMVVREDAMTLYGFLDSDERELFELVQTVSGIGPKVALAITAAMSKEELAYAVASKDEGAIAAVQGIGKKGAQRLILELEGKLAASSTTSNPNTYSWRDQLVEALTGLGFARKQAEQAINEIASIKEPKELNSLSNTELLKLALAHVNTQKGLGK